MAGQIDIWKGAKDPKPVILQLFPISVQCGLPQVIFVTTQESDKHEYPDMGMRRVHIEEVLISPLKSTSGLLATHELTEHTRSTDAPLSEPPL